MVQKRCSNCGVAITENASGSGMHPIQEEYASERGDRFCEACFFAESHDGTGLKIASRDMAEKASKGLIVEELVSSTTRDRLRSLCSVYDVSRPRGATKLETAETLVDASPTVATKEALKEGCPLWR